MIDSLLLLLSLLPMFAKPIGWNVSRRVDRDR